MSSQFDGAGKPYRDPSLVAVVVLFVVAVVAVVAMWMAPGLVPEQGGSQPVETTIPNADARDR